MKINFDKNKKSSWLDFGLSLIALVFVGSVGWLLLWRFGILKKEASVSPEMTRIQNEMNYIQKYDINQAANNLKNLVPPAQSLTIPTLTPSEIGKQNIFE